MNDKIVELAAWKGSNRTKKTGIFLTKTRETGFCTLYYLQDEILTKTIMLDFRQQALTFSEEKVPIDWENVFEINYLTAYSLLKELLDQKLRNNLKLQPKEAALYNEATHALLYHTKEIMKLPLRSKDPDKTLTMLKEALIYEDYGLLYELADTKICPAEMTKHIFIHECRERNKYMRIAGDTFQIDELREINKASGENVLAGCAAWEYYLNREHCRAVMYFELCLAADGYLLSRYLPLEQGKMYYSEKCTFRYYYEKYAVPDGRWLAGTLINDSNILLIGEKNFYQLYVFARDKCNSAAKIILKEKEMLIYADEQAKLTALAQYLAEKQISDMEELLLESAEMTALEIAEILLSDS